MASIARLTLDGPERRGAERFEVNRKGTLRASGASMDVLIENLSATGCLLRCDLVLPIGTIAHLALPGLAPRQARLVRQQSDHLGWSFLVPLKPREIETARSAEPCITPIVAENDEEGVTPATVGGSVIAPKAPLRMKLYLALALLDLLALLLAFTGASRLSFTGLDQQPNLDMLMVLMPIYLVTAMRGTAFSLAALKRPAEGVKSAACALFLATSLVIVTMFAFKSAGSFSAGLIAAGTLGAMVLIAAFRLAFGSHVGARTCWRFTNDVLLMDEAIVFPTNGELIVFADQAQIRPSSDNPVMLDRLGKLLRHVDRVVLACPASRRAAWSAMMKGVGVTAEVLSPELDDLGALGIGEVGGHATIVTTVGPLHPRDQLLKRTFDIVVASLALIAFAPLMIAIALAVKLDSPGPALFKQPRIGLGNRLFHMYKFRSMRAERADAQGSKLTQIGDSRVTRVGNFLRRTSLDELPQLLNVIAGHMSIVGPRPHAVGALAGDALYWEVDERYWDRHAVMPGLTGLAQIRGHRGTTFERADLSNRLQADLEYVEGWSLRRDLAIILRTVGVLSHPNAF
jgi:polysaccharide biosynthesis protein PslA